LIRRLHVMRSGILDEAAGDAVLILDREPLESAERSGGFAIWIPHANRWPITAQVNPQGDVANRELVGVVVDVGLERNARGESLPLHRHQRSGLRLEPD